MVLSVGSRICCGALLGALIGWSHSDAEGLSIPSLTAPVVSVTLVCLLPSYPCHGRVDIGRSVRLPHALWVIMDLSHKENKNPPEYITKSGHMPEW